MWIIALEALVALSLLLLIVWLTMGSSRRRDAGEDAEAGIGRNEDPDDKR